MWERIGIDVLLLVGVLVWPWWLTLVVLAGLSVYFRYFAEAVVFGLFLDALFAAPVATFAGFELFFTTVGIVLLFLGTFVRKQMRV